MSGKTLKIYCAGDLFDSKDLAGNLLLAEAVRTGSNGRYHLVLPQDGECEVVMRTSQSIRDADFALLFECDLILANFDGPELDSGTVTEFCFAKMVDMPALLLRSDFRDAGDHTLPDGEPWNLMCSHYPRTIVEHINSMQLYHKMDSVTDTCEFLKRFYSAIAHKVIAALDKVTTQRSWLAREEVLAQYQRAIKSIGGSLAELLPPEKLQKIVQRKLDLRIY